MCAAILAVCLATYTAFFFLVRRSHYYSGFHYVVLWVILIFLWTIPICLSRVYLGAHFFQVPKDRANSH